MEPCRPSPLRRRCGQWPPATRKCFQDSRFPIPAALRPCVVGAAIGRQQHANAFRIRGFQFPPPFALRRRGGHWPPAARKYFQDSRFPISAALRPCEAITEESRSPESIIIIHILSQEKEKGNRFFIHYAETEDRFPAFRFCFWEALRPLEFDGKRSDLSPLSRRCSRSAAIRRRTAPGGGTAG